MVTPTGEREAVPAQKPTIHILGGGPSGLSAAFHLTSPQFNPGWQNRYDVVVYQLGWRLGGKGATGRNADAFNRVEEHGIHLFGSMYANSLHMLYAAIQELGNPPSAMDLEFEASNFQLVSDFFEGRWHGFEGWLPFDDDKPWLDPSAVGSIKDIVEGIFNTVKGIFKSTELPPPPDGDAIAAASTHRWNALRWLENTVATLEGLIDAVRHGLPAAQASSDPVGALEKILTELEDLIEDGRKTSPRGSDQLDLWYWQFVQVDLLAACLRGTLADNVLVNGIDSIDDVPYRDWLVKHQLHPLTQSSSLLQAIPNTCMQYPDGDTTGFPQMSAAAYLTFVLRQMTAPGQAAYFFRVSTGETVILPLYQVLAARGVRFEFFSKITNLVPDATGTSIVKIQRQRQANVIGAPKTQYQPLRLLPDGQKVWPNVPLYSQLKEGTKLQGIDLESWWADWPGEAADITPAPGDLVIVALPPAAQAIVCAQATAAAKDPTKGWQQMLSNVRTCATQAVQIWLDESTTDLGWPDLTKSDPNQAKTNRCLGPTFANPLSAFGDFTRAIASETWPAQAKPQGLIYFCGPLQDPDPIPGFDDHDYPTRAKARVAAEATQFLRQLGGLLPNAANEANRGGVVPEPNSLDFGVLHCYRDADTTHGENRFGQQYFRANIDPNERYTISFPGTLKYRLSPWQSGYGNVILSSDAVFTGFNIGSFEGAVMAGMLAAYTITGSPTTAQIYGYDFCRPNPPVHPPMLAS